MRHHQRPTASILESSRLQQYASNLPLLQANPSQPLSLCLKRTTLYGAMAFKLLTRMLGLAAVFSAIASVEAGPYGGGFHALRIRDYTPVQLAAPSCTELSIGQKATGARVCLSVSSGTLIVSYPAVAGWTYNETQVYIGTTPPTGTAPGQYAFRSNNGYCFVSADKRTASCSIPVTGFQGVCSGSYYIATHAHVESVVAEGMTPSGATGWGAGTCITSTCKPWAMYWTNPFTLICLCTSTQVFPPVTSTVCRGLALGFNGRLRQLTCICSRPVIAPSPLRLQATAPSPPQYVKDRLLLLPKSLTS